MQSGEERLVTRAAEAGGNGTDAPVVGLIPDGMADRWDTVYTNPAALFFAPEDHARRLTALVAACGADPRGTLTDGTVSDFDRWAALCRAMPRLAGHPLYLRVHALLEAAFGWTEPLCPRNAAASWAFCAEKLCAEVCTPSVLAAWCGATFCPALFPDREGSLWDGVTDLTTLQAAMAVRLTGKAGEQPKAPPAVWMLPDGYNFARPDPYRAEKSLRAVLDAGQDAPGTVLFGDGPLDEGERYLLLTQLVRTAGRLCREAGQTLSLCGRWGALRPLIAYLDGADCLPATVCWIRDPEKVPAGAELMLPVPRPRRRDGERRPSPVSVGLWLDGGAEPEAVAGKLTAYAARFPLGAAPGVRISVRTVADLAQVAVLRRVLRNLLSRWAAVGAGPSDPEVQADLVARLSGGR